MDRARLSICLLATGIVIALATVIALTLRKSDSKSTMSLEHVVIRIAVSKSTSDGVRSSLEVHVSFVNTSEHDVTITFPAGADTQRTFQFELVDLSTGVRISMLQFSPKSYSGGWPRSIPPDGQIDLVLRDFRFMIANQWHHDLPRGNYALTCRFSEFRDRGVDSEVKQAIDSNTMQFEVDE
jgi:hypothetical protein